MFFTLSGKFVLIFKNKIGWRSTVTTEHPFKRNKIKEVGNVVNRNGLKNIRSGNDVLHPLSEVASGSSAPPIVAK